MRAASALRLSRAPACVAAVLVALLAPSVAGVGAARAAPGEDPAAWMFQPSEVVQVDLTLTDEAIAALDAAPRDYVPAGFELHGSGGRTFGPWAISLKLKGNGSFRTLAGKAAFKLKFPSGARPSGLRKLTLNNMIQDPSKVRETLAYTVFRAMGVPAPRTGYAAVRVNGADYGLYLNVETLDSVSLPNWFSGTTHLYESLYDYEARRPLSTLEPGGEQFFEVDEGNAADRSDLQALIAALQDGAPGGLATVLGDHADLDEIARMLGTEAFVGHWDGYGWGVNNFYLHSDAAGRFTLLPWGTDHTLETASPLQGSALAPEGVLLVRCLADPACAAARADAQEQAAGLADELALSGLATALHEVLRPYIAGDPRDEQTVEDSDAALGDVRAYLAARAPRVPEPPAEPAPRVASATPVDLAPPPVAEPPSPAPAPPAALSAARARGAVARALRVRFPRVGRPRITCAPVSPNVRRCRARWAAGGRRHDRRVMVRLGPDGRLTSVAG